MTNNEMQTNAVSEHDKLVELLPWYVKGTLSPAERALVKQHLEDCGFCQMEVMLCNTVDEQLPPPAVEWKPSPAHFRQVLTEVDKLEAVASQPQSSRANAERGLIQRIASWFAQTPGAVRWVLATETLALATLAAFVAIPLLHDTEKQGVFETLSDGETAIASSGLGVRLILAEDMTTGELSKLLKQAKAQIRHGPTAVGAYTVEVPPTDAAQSITTLRAFPKVRLAQPLETAKPEP